MKRVRRFVRTSARVLSQGLVRAVVTWVASLILHYGVKALLVFMSHR